MDPAMEGIMAFIAAAENLKNTLRCSFSSSGRQESAAEHSWRLCLLVMVCSGYFPGLQREKIVQMAVVHDLAEALCGDTPATDREGHAAKTAREREAIREIVRPLPGETGREIVALWEEYTAGTSEEAQYVKALDKLETLMQHNQGQNPSGFDYAFNLGYGVAATRKVPGLAALRELIDRETKKRIG